MGTVLRSLRAGAALGLRRLRYRRYFQTAAGLLWRELRTPGGPDRLERSLRKATRRASGCSPSAWIETRLLGGGSPEEFSTVIDEVSREFAEVAAGDFPEVRLADDHLTGRCARAIREAVASSSESDIVARQVLRAHGSAKRIRASWRVVSASLGAATIGLGAGWAAEAATSSDGKALVAGWVGAALAEAVGLGAFAISSGAHARNAHRALRGMVDALLLPNVPCWTPLSLPERLRDVPLAGKITQQLARIASLASRASSSEILLWRWDGEERAALRKAAREAADALHQLKPHPDWKAPDCVAANVEKLLATNREKEDLETQLSNGSLAWELLVCCAAVAIELENALGMTTMRAA